MSIKKIIEDQNNENKNQLAPNQEQPRENFTIDNVNIYWRQFANRMKDEGKETFYNAMIKRNPKSSSETLFLFEVDNQVQIDVINSDLDRLMTFMRSSLKNFDFTIEIKQTDNQEEDVRNLTNKDKFAILSKKFPNIHVLKNTFNLDVDY
ncbi:MAG: hypothetical protein M9916_04395 [Crocinitomicaceae bacterium]|nr:hypothetical protein [Crocinitomicaceae bacterium]